MSAPPALKLKLEFALMEEEEGSESRSSGKW